MAKLPVKNGKILNPLLKSERQLKQQIKMTWEKVKQKDTMQKSRNLITTPH
jgi:hypothetical protein